MRLEQLEYFIEAINCNSINKAAKNLYISQPTLSLSIAKMEEEIGAKLLYRTKKGVVPTIIGNMVYNDALKIVTTTNSFLEDWKNTVLANQEIAGDVLLYSIPSASVFISNFVMQELKEILPNTGIFIHEGHLHENLQNLIDSGLNIGLGSYKIPLKKEFMQSIPDGWIVEELFQDQLSILISPKNALSKKDFITKDDCSKLTLAYYWSLQDKQPPTYLNLFDTASAIRSNTKNSIMELVAENMAVAVFPQKITKHDFFQKNNLIVSILFDNSLNMPDIMHYVAYKNNLTPAEKKVIDIIHYCANTYYE